MFVRCQDKGLVTVPCFFLPKNGELCTSRQGNKVRGNGERVAAVFRTSVRYRATGTASLAHLANAALRVHWCHSNKNAVLCNCGASVDNYPLHYVPPQNGVFVWVAFNG